LLRRRGDVHAELILGRHYQQAVHLSVQSGVRLDLDAELLDVHVDLEGVEQELDSRILCDIETAGPGQGEALDRITKACEQLPHHPVHFVEVDVPIACETRTGRIVSLYRRGTALGRAGFITRLRHGERSLGRADVVG
jgi:hypothetical protein